MTSMVKLSKKTKIISAILVALFVLWTIVPMVLMIQASFKPRALMSTDPPTFIFTPELSNYINLFTQHDIFKYMWNSIIVAFFTTILCLALGSTAAYALSSIELPGRNALAFVVIATRMIPAGALMVPIYVMMRMLGLANTHVAIIITHTVLNLSFSIWMMRSFFDEVPKEIEQAAMVDGCTKLQSFFRIALPLASSGLVATGILVVMASWNEFMFALILSNNATRTLPMAISGFLSVSIEWGPATAAATIASIPVFIVAIFIQKYLVRGLTQGAMKG